jgi:hypothetical protein
MKAKARAHNSAARQRKAKAKPRGKPFAPANPYRWVPGQSGNPAGNADVLVVRAALLRHAQREATDALRDVGGLTWLDRIAIEQLKRAAEDTDGFSELADRIDGKPKQSTEHSGPNGGPIALDFTAAIERIYGTPDGAGDGADNAAQSD